MKFCRFCGTKEIQFRKSGKFGCVHCAQIFNFPKPYRKTKIQENIIKNLESFLKTNTNSIQLLSFRTRITRNLKSSLFPYYDPMIDKSKQLLVENGLGFDLVQDTDFSFENSVGDFEPRTGFYLGSEDHIRWEVITPHSLTNGNQNLLWEKKKISIFRFLFRNSLWAKLPGIGFVSSCPSNLGAGRRDSLLLGLDPEVVSEFFSILQTLSEFGIEFAPSTDHRMRNIGKDRVLVVKISWKNALAVQKRQFYKILGLLGSY